MIGMVLVTHGGLAAAFVASLERLAGPQPQTAAICIGPDDDMERRREEIVAAVDHVDHGRGVVVVTDMFGGTPSNLAISMLDRGGIEVIAGANLPMLLALTRVRGNGGLARTVAAAREAGQAAIEGLGAPASGPAGDAPLGAVVVTHGRLAAEFVAATEHVVGPQEAFAALVLDPAEPEDGRRARVAAAVEACERGRGVVVLVNGRDGPTAGLVTPLLDRPGLRAVAGVNLPMLIKLTGLRLHDDLARAADGAMEAGRKYISVASTLLAVDRS